jgi:hypothetical protein
MSGIASANPPLRIASTASSSLSSAQAKAHIDVFLARYYERSAETGSTGDSTMRTRLEGMSSALQEEIQRKD